MAYRKIRRKILTDDGEKMYTLYNVLCKYGTHGTTVAYLFDEPVVGKVMNAIVDDGINLTDNNLRYQRVSGVRITSIRSDDFVFLERF